MERMANVVMGERKWPFSNMMVLLTFAWGKSAFLSQQRKSPLVNPVPSKDIWDVEFLLGFHVVICKICT